MIKKSLGLLALLAISAALLVSSLFSAESTNPKNQIVLLRVYTSTNYIPGYIGGPDPKIGTNGFFQNSTISIAVIHPARTNVVKNYVLGFLDGTNAVELLTVINQ
jgi:hypothetical protein